MEKITRESWQQHIVAWEKSGLSKATFCRQTSLVYHKFCYRCRRLKAPSPIENLFVPLSPAQLPKLLAYNLVDNNFAQQSGVHLFLGGVRIELEPGFC